MQAMHFLTDLTPGKWRWSSYAPGEHNKRMPCAHNQRPLWWASLTIYLQMVIGDLWCGWLWMTRWQATPRPLTYNSTLRAKVYMRWPCAGLPEGLTLGLI